jgi:hypothetical protein
MRDYPVFRFNALFREIPEKGYVLDSGSPKILWLPSEEPRNSVQRPRRPPLTVFRAPSRRAPPDEASRAASAHCRGGRPAVATPTCGGYLSQAHSPLPEIRAAGRTRYAEKVYVVAGKTLHLGPES